MTFVYDDLCREASSNNDFCFDDNCFGIFTLTRTNKSPLPCELFKRGMPRPARRKTCSGWVPAGIFQFDFSIQCFHFRFTAEQRSEHIRCCGGVQIVAIVFKTGILSNFHDKIQVASIRSRTGHTHLRAGLHSGRYADLNAFPFFSMERRAPL